MQTLSLLILSALLVAGFCAPARQEIASIEERLAEIENERLLQELAKIQWGRFPWRSLFRAILDPVYEHTRDYLERDDSTTTSSPTTSTPSPPISVTRRQPSVLAEQFNLNRFYNDFLRRRNGPSMNADAEWLNDLNDIYRRLSPRED